tara:strand:+ start:485 stop:1252 length:768 start_codon:yes stop_codon:yes gene_type:complete
MGTITLDVSAQTNQPPNAIGWLTLKMVYSATHAFTLENFTTETTPPYSDPEGDDLEAIKITFLPKKGVLKLNGVDVVVGDIIQESSLDGSALTYVSDSSDIDGYTDGYMKYSASDVGSSTFTTSEKTITFGVLSDINYAPSSVGDGEEEITLGESFVFTVASLTTSLNAAYADPENDQPYKLLVVSLPSFGTLQFDGINVVEDQEIPFDNTNDGINDGIDILNGKLIYRSESLPTGALEGFEFQISDTGSKQYIG